MVTRKTFDATAKAIFNALQDSNADHNVRSALWDVASKMAIYFQDENPNFKRDFFMNACGF